MRNRHVKALAKALVTGAVVGIVLYLVYHQVYWQMIIAATVVMFLWEEYDYGKLENLKDQLTEEMDGEDLRFLEECFDYTTGTRLTGALAISGKRMMYRTVPTRKSGVVNVNYQFDRTTLSFGRQDFLYLNNGRGEVRKLGFFWSRDAKSVEQLLRDSGAIISREDALA